MTARRGFALLAAVWLMVGIAAIGLEVSWLARSRRLAIANAIEGEQARAAASAGLEQARAHLARALAISRVDALADPWRYLDAGASDSVGVARYEFQINDDAAFLDVNVASEAMLARLFVACGADLPSATTAAARIADWRDADQLRRAHGAEREDYLAAAARVLPRDAAVQSVAELDDVLEMPAASWRCVRPRLAVHGAGLVNPNTAPSEVLQALPGVSALVASAIVAARRDGPLHDWREFLAAVPAGMRGNLELNAEALQRLLVYQTNVVRVISAASLDASPVHVVAEALVRRTGGTAFTEWRSFR